MLLTVSNVTPPKQKRVGAPQEIAENEAFAQAVLQNILEGIIAIDERGVMLAANASAERIFGYTAEELIGQPVTMLMPAPFKDEHDQYLQNYKDTGVRKIIGIGREVFGQRKDGSIFPLDLGVSEISIGGRRIFSGVVRDLTERDEVAQALQRHEQMAQELDRANTELRREITEQKTVEEQLQESLREKEILLKEIHHRVKNNLQLVSSLLNIRLRRLEGYSTQQIVEELRSRIHSIALIHEMLYQAGDMGRIRLGSYIESLATHLVRYFGASSSVVLRVKAQDVVLGLDQTIPCGLFVNEVLTNCLKHAFPGGRHGKIEITLSQSKDRSVFLEIADDGIGMKQGKENGGRGSLGMDLVHQLGRKVGGIVDVDTHPGTIVRLRFQPQDLPGA